MGFELTCLVTSPLPPVARARVTRDLLGAFPFLRLPASTNEAHPERIVLGAIEQTSYMLDGETETALARAFDDKIAAALEQLTGLLVGVGIVLVHTDCFGGNCTDAFTYAFDGAVVNADPGSLVDGLARVGLETRGSFAGFVRDHFGPQLQVRAFARLLGPEGLAELLAAQDDDIANLIDQPWINHPIEPAPGALRVDELERLRARPLRLRSLLEDMLAVERPSLRSVDLGSTPWSLSGPEDAAPLLLLDLEAARRRVGRVALACPYSCSAPDAEEIERVGGQCLALMVHTQCTSFVWAIAVELDDAARGGLARAITSRLETYGPEDVEVEIEILDATRLCARSQRLTDEHGWAPAQLWLERVLDDAHGLDEIERRASAEIDRLGPSHADAWSVLGDRLSASGDPRGDAINLDLRARSSAPGPAREALEAQLAHARARLWTPAEQRLVAVAEAGEARRALDERFFPMLWCELVGPFLSRLVVSPAWVYEGHDDPISLGSWRPDYRQPRPDLEPLRRILALPCARYLSVERVTALGERPPVEDLSGRDLSGFDLSPVRVEMRRLSGARLDRARFASLRRCDLRGASLRQAGLERADMRLVDLRGADLRGAQAKGADLQYADLRGSKLAGADLRGADLRGADLRDVELGRVQLEAANLAGARLERAQLAALPEGLERDTLDVDPDD